MPVESAPLLHPPRPEDEFMSLQEICDGLHVSYTTGLRWKKSGLLPPPAYRLTSRVQRWRRSDIEAWLKEHPSAQRETRSGDPVPAPWEQIPSK